LKPVRFKEVSPDKAGKFDNRKKMKNSDAFGSKEFGGTVPADFADQQEALQNEDGGGYECKKCGWKIADKEVLNSHG
jgi:hypothetical protein